MRRYKNISLGDITGDKCISLTTSYGAVEGLDEPRPQPRGKSPRLSSALTKISNINYMHIKRGGTTIADKGAGDFACFKDAPCQNITLLDARLKILNFNQGRWIFCTQKKMSYQNS